MIEQVLHDFTQFMDSLYYEGFTEQFAKDYPKEFLDEFNQYLDTITWKEGK